MTNNMQQYRNPKFLCYLKEIVIWTFPGKVLITTPLITVWLS